MAKAPKKASSSKPALPAEALFSTRELPKPNARPLQVYAFDPSAGRLIGNVMQTAIHYEELKPGPVGERFAVIDYDGAHNCYYHPVNLDDPNVLIRGGLDPSQSDPRFHQQMVYAVASETLQRFEFALGRRVHWRGVRGVSGVRSALPRRAALRLNLFPHAMCDANAFYSPDAHGILFGYFQANSKSPGRNLPGQTVFTCLSHDIVAHETTHAIVDGIRSHFTEATNIDVPAFHEAFADLAALFAHFAHREVLCDTLNRTGGQLFSSQLRADVPGGEKQAQTQSQISGGNPLIGLAMQFGEAAGMRGALRGALDTPANSKDIETKTEPHARGSILVASVFDAYLATYVARTRGLFQTYRAGGGQDNPKDLPTPMVNMLADIAARTAEDYFNVCARALDYCPPIDITFGDFLRAVVTAHMDFDPTDKDNIRDALMEGFRLRGIWAESARFFSEDSLCWPKVARNSLKVPGLVFGDPNGLTTAEKNANGDVLRAFAKKNARRLGFASSDGIAAESFHPMFHIADDGRLYVDMVIELVQTRRFDFSKGAGADTFPMRSGVTLLVTQDPPENRRDRPAPRVRFIIPKLFSAERLERQATYFGIGQRNAATGDSRFLIDFSLLHAGV